MADTVANLNRHDYAEYVTLRDKLIRQTARTHVENLYGQAMAYAWGREDGGNGRDDSYPFAIAYGIVAAEYEAEIRVSRPPIRDAYDRWCRGEIITR